MNKEKQRVAIAEVCGWSEIDQCSCSEGSKRGIDPDGKGYKKHLPDYLDDFNAMHDALSIFKDDSLKQATFCHDLFGVIHGQAKYGDGVSEFDKINATAEQLAQAFLKTLGLWEDE